MIEAIELRIGNHLKWKDNQQEFKVTIGMFLDVNFWNHIKNNDIIPIPLTEEWAMKLALKYMEEAEYTASTFDFAGFKLWYTNGKFLFNDTIQIKYVHRLQNLYFELKDKELKIKE